MGDLFLLCAGLVRSSKSSHHHGQSTHRTTMSGGDELPPMPSAEEMKAAKIPLAYRDRCAGLLIKLNKCRIEGSYLPWNCENERHEYEKCEYLDFKHRVKAIQAAKAAEAAN
ncbi:NADH-ubiquinone oxidoreductase B18 subunit-domain-containing protein [Dipodascopsis tothii]|uniref:NADH-ubiquinone oxidoreductase B18 subunit-domain-containing protein n=1 Tax=Dipodascopsis tothii TaxID=44089 RepID=UPI0034D00FA3